MDSKKNNDRKNIEQFFKREKLIIKDASIFENDYTPQEIITRKETYKLYSEISEFINYRSPNNILLIGLPGTGKTVTIMDMQKKMNDLFLPSNFNLS